MWRRIVVGLPGLYRILCSRWRKPDKMLIGIDICQRWRHGRMVWQWVRTRDAIRIYSTRIVRRLRSRVIIVLGKIIILLWWWQFWKYGWMRDDNRNVDHDVISEKSLISDAHMKSICLPSHPHAQFDGHRCLDLKECMCRFLVIQTFQYASADAASSSRNLEHEGSYTLGARWYNEIGSSE